MLCLPLVLGRYKASKTAGDNIVREICNQPYIPNEYRGDG